MTVSSIQQVPQHVNQPEFMNESLPAVPTPTYETEMKCMSPPSSQIPVELASSETHVQFTSNPSSDTRVELNINPSSETELKCSTPISSETEVEFVNQKTSFPSKDIRYVKTAIKKSIPHPNKLVGDVKKKVQIVK